jgi:hypothetical protein
MSISLKEIQNYHSQIDISPNIIYNAIESLSNPSKSKSSIRINYLINENDEILFINHDENIEKFYTFLFYEVFIIKIDAMKKKSKMIMIYNNENKEYNIKIWVSKIEKPEIKDEYNKIIKKICSNKKNSNKIIRNLLKLKPDKYTIYYFPINVPLFDKELVFIYIYVITQNEKAKFQNFKQVNDLIAYSKSFLIPKIDDLLLKYENKNHKNISHQNTKNFFKIIINDNKENIIFNKMNRNNNYFSPKNEDILINYNSEIFKKKDIRKKKNNSKKRINFIRKPYNKILFNYSFEKNINDKDNNKVKKKGQSYIETKNKISSIIIDTNRNSLKSNNFINYSLNRIKKLTNKDKNMNNQSINGLSFSMSNYNCNYPYEKKRPSSIPKKIDHYLSTRSYNIKKNNENDLDINNQNSCATFTNNSISYNNNHFLYRKKTMSKNKSKENINLNSNFFIEKMKLKNNNSIYGSNDIDRIYKRKNYSITLNKNRKLKSSMYDGSMLSINQLSKRYRNINNNKDDNNISIIEIKKKSTLNINKVPQIVNKLNMNNGNKTSRNVINKKMMRQLIKYNIKNLNKTGNNLLKKLNDNEGEISLFL